MCCTQMFKHRSYDYFDKSQLLTLVSKVVTVSGAIFKHLIIWLFFLFYFICAI